MDYIGQRRRLVTSKNLHMSASMERHALSIWVFMLGLALTLEKNWFAGTMELW